MKYLEVDELQFWKGLTKEDGINVHKIIPFWFQTVEELSLMKPSPKWKAWGGKCQECNENTKRKKIWQGANEEQNWD